MNLKILKGEEGRNRQRESQHTMRGHSLTKHLFQLSHGELLFEYLFFGLWFGGSGRGVVVFEVIDVVHTQQDGLGQVQLGQFLTTTLAKELPALYFCFDFELTIATTCSVRPLQLCVRKHFTQYLKFVGGMKVVAVVVVVVVIVEGVLSQILNEGVS